MLPNETVTIFNFHEGYWYPRVVKDVHIEVSKASMLKEYGPDCKDSVSMHVPLINGKLGEFEFFPKDQFTGEGITLAEGDLILIGEYYEEPILDSNYPTGFYDCLNWKGFLSFRISSISYFSLIPHFEVTAN